MRACVCARALVCARARWYPSVLTSQFLRGGSGSRARARSCGCVCVCVSCGHTCVCARVCARVSLRVMRVKSIAVQLHDQIELQPGDKIVFGASLVSNHVGSGEYSRRSRELAHNDCCSRVAWSVARGGHARECVRAHARARARMCQLRLGHWCRSPLWKSAHTGISVGSALSS